MCNHQFFVGRNHNGNSFAVGSGNHTGITEAGFQVGFLVNVQTEEAQVAQYTFADDVGVFTDTAGETNASKPPAATVMLPMYLAKR